jgi:hypothetical protein
MSKLVLSVQSFLKFKGFDPGDLDGVEGPNTSSAWNAFLDSQDTHPEIKTQPASNGDVPATSTSQSGYTFDFNSFFEFLMEWEWRYYENDPADPGGATKFGIDQRSHPNVNIRALTEADAKAIYWQEWNAQDVGEFPCPLRQVYFNYCVNTGQGRAVKLVQKALGITQDGGLGLTTKAAIANCEPKKTALAMIDAADDFYRSLNKPKFLKGWLNRNHALRFIIS